MKSRISWVWSGLKGLPVWLKWTVSILLLVVLIVVVVSSQNRSTGVMVATDEVKKRTIDRSVIASGRLESAEKQDFFTHVDSTVMELSVTVGDRVKKGQVLGRLDTLELGRQYEEAKAKLANKQAELAAARAVNDDLRLESTKAAYTKAQNHLARIEHLYQEGAVAMVELESAKVDFTQARVDYELAKITTQEKAAQQKAASLQAQVDLAVQEVAQAGERVDLATFIAREDGVALIVEAEKGKRVQEGSRIMVVGSDKKLEVTANVNEIDAGSLKTGQPVKITCASLPDREFMGKINRVAAVAVSEKGNQNSNISVPVTIELEDQTAGLKPGYTVDLNIITMEKKEFLTVPFEAIVTKTDQKMVFVVENGVAKERKVKTETGNELYEIVLAGLGAGDQVIMNPPQHLKDGQKVAAGERK